MNNPFDPGQMTPEQLDAWKATLAHRAQRLGSDPVPVQQNLVTVPPAAVADRWIIEWKWRYPTPAHQAMWAGQPANRPPEWKDDKPETPWRPWENLVTGKIYEITDRESAHQRVRRMRQVYPWHRFRLRESHYARHAGWVSGPEDFIQ